MTLFSPDFERFSQAMEDDENVGWCRDCGAEHENIEPDAEDYKCEDCGARSVHGAAIYALNEWVDCS